MITFAVAFHLYTLINRVDAVASRLENPVEFVSPESRYGSVPDRYIVKLRPRYSLENHFNYLNVSRSHPHIKDIHDHTNFIQAYSGTFPKDVLDRILTDPGVERVTQDQFMRPSKIEIHQAHNISQDQDVPEGEEMPNKISRRGWLPSWFSLTKQSNAPWNLAILSNPDPYDPRLAARNYWYLRNPGEHVNIYIVRGGAVNPTSHTTGGVIDIHPELQGRVRSLPKESPADFHTVTKDDIDKYAIAAVAAGKKSGVAKSASIVDVRKGNTVADFIEALHSIVQEHNQNYDRGGKSGKWRGSVALTSLEVKYEMAELWQAVREATIAGVAIVVSAGHRDNNQDAEEAEEALYPCFYFGVLCVTATREKASLTRWSQFGSAINIMAPGDRIQVTSYKGRGFESVWGTDMAAAHVAGVIAMYMGHEKMQRDVPKAYLRIKNNAKEAHRLLAAGTAPANRKPTYVLNNGLGSTGGLFSDSLYYMEVEPPPTQDYSRSLRDSRPTGRAERYTCSSHSAVGYIQDTETIIYGLELARGQQACLDIDPAQWQKPQAIGGCSGGLCPYLKVISCDSPPPSYSRTPTPVDEDLPLPPYVPSPAARAAVRGHDGDDGDGNEDPGSWIQAPPPKPTHSCLPDTSRLKAAAQRIYSQCKSDGIFLGERVAGWSEVEGTGDCIIQFGIQNGNEVTELPLTSS